MSLNVEATGFEPATPRPPAECATGLRHASMYKIQNIRALTT